jgi:hypothetical protein
MGGRGDVVWRASQGGAPLEMEGALKLSMEGIGETRSAGLTGGMPVVVVAAAARVRGPGSCGQWRRRAAGRRAGRCTSGTGRPPSPTAASTGPAPARALAPPPPRPRRCCHAADARCAVHPPLPSALLLSPRTESLLRALLHSLVLPLRRTRSVFHFAPRASRAQPVRPLSASRPARGLPPSQSANWRQPVPGTGAAGAAGVLRGCALSCRRSGCTCSAKQAAHPLVHKVCAHAWSGSILPAI